MRACVIRKSSAYLFLVAFLLAIPLGCGQPEASQPMMSREQAVQKATEDAKRSAPEVGMQEAGGVTQRSEQIVPTASSLGEPGLAKQPAAPTPTPMELPGGEGWQVYSSAAYNVTLRYPPSWKLDPRYTSPDSHRYSGTDGFFMLSASNANTIDEAAESEANHKLRPYGSTPSVTNMKVQGQDARLIMPSSDQASEMESQAALVVVSPRPIQIAGASYKYLVLWADKGHIQAIANTLRFGSTTSGMDQAPSPSAGETTPPTATSAGYASAPITPTRTSLPSPTVTRQPTPAPRVASTSTPQLAPTTAGGPSGSSTPVGTPTPVATRIVGSRFVPPSPRYEPLPLRPDATLENQIRELLGKDIDSYGVVVKRLSDGAGVAINADQEFYAASLFKVLVMFEVFKQRDLKLLSFDELLTFTPPYLDYGLGPLRWPVWSQVSVRDLLEAAITESNNVAAMMLHDRTGGWNIIGDYRSIGLKHTDIAADDMPTSAGDMALWLEMIACGKVANEKSRQEMIDLLARQKINDRLPALLPQGIKVAHKTGNWENATHDVGIVYAPHGAYVIAVLSDKAWESEPIAELSRLVYQHFEGGTGG